MPLKVGDLTHVEVFCPSQFCEQLTSLISNLGRNPQTVSLFAGTSECDIAREMLGQLDYLVPWVSYPARFQRGGVNYGRARRQSSDFKVRWRRSKHLLLPRRK